MKVFLDANVWVCGLTARGVCVDVIRIAATNGWLVATDAVSEEVIRVLADKFDADAAQLARARQLLAQASEPEEDIAVKFPKLRDVADEAILRSALRSGARVFVTGDRDFLDVRGKLPLRVLSPREFIEQYGR
jgi:putative PIN family toxin of toxin-antitoxin system